MSEHLRDRLHDEMSRLVLPPAGDLVGRAEAGGVRTRRVRRTASGMGTVAVVGLTVLAVTIGSQLGAGPAATSVAGQAGGGSPSPAVATAAVTSPATVAAVTPQAVVVPAVVAPAESAPGGGTVADKAAAAKAVHALQTAASVASPPQWADAPAGVAATPQGELQLFTELAAPYGSVSQVAVSEDADKTHVRARLTTPDGKTGGLQFSLYHDTLGYAGDCVAGLPNATTCHRTDDGGYVINADDHADCVNTADITVVHPDGTAVWVTLSACMADGANQLTPGTQTLSRSDVETIFQNPGFDFAMPADVVARGEQQLGTLATFW